MPNKIRDAAYVATLVAALTLFDSAPWQIAQAAEEDQPESNTNASPRPENTPRPLPADTFKPSEEISEDFPVPFPVDI